MDIKKIVHVGKFPQKPLQSLYLLDADGLFFWHGFDDLQYPSIPLAIQWAFKSFKDKNFTLINCGYRYTLPERDEVGSVALFKHMVASYSSPNGFYFDPELGHMAKVDFASQEALKLWKSLIS